MDSGAWATAFCLYCARWQKVNTGTVPGLRPSTLIWDVGTCISAAVPNSLLTCFFKRDMLREERKRERDSFPKWLRQPGLGQAEAKSSDPHPGFPHAWAITCCFSSMLIASWIWSRGAGTRTLCSDPKRCHRKGSTQPRVNTNPGHCLLLCLRWCPPTGPWEHVTCYSWSQEFGFPAKRALKEHMSVRTSAECLPFLQILPLP